MAYTSDNKLRRIIEIQNITTEHTQKGVTQDWVFKNIIKSRFFISFSTYNNYLGINAKNILHEKERQMKKALQVKKALQEKQMKLF